MKYSKKITEYALLPNKAFPLDARSHFVDVNTAIKAITQDLITTAEEAALVENSYKKYYVGQIITTTNDGTYQVTNNVNSFYNNIEDYEVCFQFNRDCTQIETIIDKNALFPAIQPANETNQTLNLYKVLLKTGAYILVNGNKIAAQQGFVISNNYIQWDIQCYLKPFSGGGGGSSTLSITANEPLNFDKATSTLTLSIDSDSALAVSGQGLTLSLGAGLITKNNALTLDVDGLVNNNNSIYVLGNHKTIEKNGAIDAININNYIYQKI